MGRGTMSALVMAGDGMVIKAGDVVRFGAGRVEWTVTEVRPNTCIVGAISPKGRHERRHAQFVTLIRRGKPALEFEDDGSVVLGSKVVRAADRYAAVVAEWSAPVHRLADPNVPSTVELSIHRDVEGRKYLRVAASGPINPDDACLTRESAIELGAAVAKLAAQLPE